MPIKRKTWKEFRETGLLWRINSAILHLYGWALVFEYPDKTDEGEPIAVYPARVSFRGFTREADEKGYEMLTTYMAREARELLGEVFEVEMPEGVSLERWAAATPEKRAAYAEWRKSDPGCAGH